MDQERLSRGDILSQEWMNGREEEKILYIQDAPRGGILYI
jgi:hypothetical protein